MCIGRILNCVGLKQYSFDTDHTDEKITDGKCIIEGYKYETGKMSEKYSSINRVNQ